jgi:hypothetical protein
LPDDYLPNTIVSSDSEDFLPGLVARRLFAKEDSSDSDVLPDEIEVYCCRRHCNEVPGVVAAKNAWSLAAKTGPENQGILHSFVNSIFGKLNPLPARAIVTLFPPPSQPAPE